MTSSPRFDWKWRPSQDFGSNAEAVVYARGRCGDADGGGDGTWHAQTTIYLGSEVLNREFVATDLVAPTSNVPEAQAAPTSAMQLNGCGGCSPWTVVTARPRWPRYKNVGSTAPDYHLTDPKTPAALVDLLAVSHQLGPCRSYTNICAGCNLHRYPRDLMRLASSGDNTTADPSEPVPLPRAVKAKTLGWNMRSLLRASTARDLVPPPPPPPPPPRRKTRPSNTVGDLGALAHPSSCQRPAGMSRRRNRFKLSPWL
ncbi:hypothetical protein ACCO45_005637 [Purpureocillium lilacinum]|uniref:Uncharacterized protein n=1 Tax=Purpureocillium lilacinum TaxID=33203 RepID=A0ACC4DW13_PURLI